MVRFGQLFLKLKHGQVGFMVRCDYFFLKLKTRSAWYYGQPCLIYTLFLQVPTSSFKVESLFPIYLKLRSSPIRRVDGPTDKI